MEIYRKCGEKFYYNMDLNNQTQEINTLLKSIEKLINNYETLSNEEFYTLFTKFYTLEETPEEDDIVYEEDTWKRNGYTTDYQSETKIIIKETTEDDRLTMLNLMYNTNYTKLTALRTTMVRTIMEGSGHGRRFEYWEEAYQRYLVVATSNNLDTNKIYTKEELKHLLSEKQILPLEVIEKRIQDKTFPEEPAEELATSIKPVMTKTDALVAIIKDKLPKNKLIKELKEYIKELSVFYAIEDYPSPFPKRTRKPKKS